jgi:hypothetical protein
MKTLTEKYNAVLEGKFSKSQFVKDAKRELPKLISPYNGYNDTVQILKSKGMIFEAVKDTYVSSAELEYSKVKGIDKFPIQDVERGIDYELEAAGFDSVSLDGVTQEERDKACKKVVKNLEKDPLHYINLISGESSKVDKHDKMVPVKKGNEVDTFNGMKKAELKEEVELPSSVLSKANVAVKDAKSMAGLLLQFIDQVDDKENPNIFKNAKLKRAVEFLKDLSDDEASAPAATNEKATFVNIASGPDDVIDPHDYVEIGQGYLKNFKRPHTLKDADLETLGRKIVKVLAKGDIEKAKAKFIDEQMSDVEMAAIKDYGKEEQPVKPYVLGDKFSTDFDYEGMLKAGLKVRLNTSLEDLQKLYDSFEDVNYHSENRFLSDVIDKIEKKDKSGALDAIRTYKKELNKTLDSINEGTSPIREVMNIDRLGRKKSDKESNYTGGAAKKLKEYRGSADDIDRIVKDKAMDSGFEEREEAAEVIEYLANKYNLNLKMIQSYMDSPDEPVNPFADDDAPKMHEDDVEETKGAPKGHYFTKTGNLVKGRLTKAARERGARLSDPKDKQRSKVPPVTQYNEITESTQEESVAKLIQDYYRNPKTGVSMISDEIVSEYYRTHKDWDQDGKWDGTKEGNERGMDDFNEFFDANYGYMFPSAADLDEKKGKDHDGDGDIDSDDYMAARDKAIKKAMGKDELAKESIKAIITKVLEEGVITEAATQELAKMADSYAGFDGMKGVVMTLQDIVTDIERYYENTRNKIQKAFDAMGDVKNEEGLKVGGFLAPAVETAFNRDLKPVVKLGFTRGIEQPKVKVLTQADIDAAKMGGAIAEEEPKQTVFTPVNETKIKIKKK